METVLDLAEIFVGKEFDLKSYEALKGLAFSGSESLHRFLERLATLEREAITGSANGSAELKLGMGYFLLGNLERTAHWLEKARVGGMRAFHLGLAYREMKRFEASNAQFEAAAQQGWAKAECDCERAENLLLQGRADEAAAVLDAVSQKDSSAWHHAKGRYWRAVGELDKAVAELEKAAEIDPSNERAIFHLAFIYNLYGSDDRAKELYESLQSRPAVHVNTLMNLAVIYEDEGEFDRAAQCLRRVLAVDPGHNRAGLYLKDVLAAGEMFIDDQRMMDSEKKSAILSIPVTDFELSVRSRNCLKKMNIHTLGDLLRATELELLAYKNFGETSLKEIKEMLRQKGLTLGQFAHEKEQAPGAARKPQAAPASPDVGLELAGQPVSKLELSVRSRKCLQALGINTIGELADRTEAELLNARNFGQTSLEEIKKGLTQLGLSLREAS